MHGGDMEDGGGGGRGAACSCVGQWPGCCLLGSASLRAGAVGHHGASSQTDATER
jgi:hypothetical protein